MSQERILVVGGGGFLGSHLCDYFGTQGYEVAAVGRSPKYTHPSSGKLAFFYPTSLPDAALSAIVTQFQPTVLMFAAGTASVPESVKAPYEDFKRSVDTCAFTLETLRTCASDCAFIFLSSGALYGNSTELPIPETAACRPVSPYGYHKQICELLIQEYGHLYGLRASVLRIFSAYGERLRRQVIHDLCQKLLDPSLNPIELHGTGQESRDFIHASDIARAIECIIQTGAHGLYNVGTGQQTTIAQLADWLNELVPHPKTILFNQRVRPGDPVQVEADITKLKTLNFAPSITLKAGIQRYFTWFTSHRIDS